MSKTFFDSALFDRVKKAVSNMFPKVQPGRTDPNVNEEPNAITWGDFFSDVLSRNAEDKERYADYDLMDAEVPEISTALDVMADYIVYPDTASKTKMFKVLPRNESKDITKAIDEIDVQTNFKNEFPGIARDACKYGDDVEEVLRTVDSRLVAKMKHVPLYSVNVNIKNGILSENPITQFDDSGKEVATLADSDVLHFSLPTDRSRAAKTGKGVSRIEKCRLIYRQLRLMEEGVMITRLARANQNFALIVDVGDLTGDEALDYLDKYKKRINRKKYIDPKTGRMSLKFNPLSVIEDILVPTRQGSSGNVIPLNNGATGKDMDDIVYFQNKLMYSTGVPKILLGKEEDVNSKTTGDIQYISFLRTIRRIQILLEPTIKKFYRLALEAKGFKNVDLKIEWPLLGTIDEERRWKIEQLKMDLAGKLSQDLNLVDDQWIYKNLMDMTDDEIKELTTRLDQIEQNYKDEVDEMLAQAEDETPSPSDPSQGEEGEDPDEEPIVGKKTAKKAKADAAKEAVLAEMRERGAKIDSKLATFLVDATPAFRKTLYEYVALTQAKLGE